MPEGLFFSSFFFSNRPHNYEKCYSEAESGLLFRVGSLTRKRRRNLIGWVVKALTKYMSDWLVGWFRPKRRRYVIGWLVYAKTLDGLCIKQMRYNPAGLP